MEISSIEVGRRYTYYPPQSVDDRRHFPAVVEAITKRRVRVRVYMDGAPDGVVRSVSARRLSDQPELPL